MSKVKSKSKAAYIRGMKRAAEHLKQEYLRQKTINPGNLDGYTHGWLYSMLWGKIRNLEGKRNS